MVGYHYHTEIKMDYTKAAPFKTHVVVHGCFVSQAHCDIIATQMVFTYGMMIH